MKRLHLFVLTGMLAACAGAGSGSPAGGQPPTSNPVPPPSTATFADTTGRVGLFQEFDHLMDPGQIQNDAARYDGVWGANQPQAWLSLHRGMVVSR